MEKISITPEQIFCPQPMYVIGTKDEDEQANFSVITWIGFNWNGCPHIMLGIGGKKKTKDNILREKTFSANLVSTDMVWLADYFGCTKGNEGKKDKVHYDFSWGKNVDVPILEQSKWIFECRVSETIELKDSHIFISKIENIQIDKQFKDMDLQMIDLLKLNPVIYAPYSYFSIGDKLGNCGDWSKYFNYSK